MTLCGVLWPPLRCRAIGSASGGVGETFGSRRWRDGTAAAAPRAAPDGPPTDSEHAECMYGGLIDTYLVLFQVLSSVKRNGTKS